MRRIFRLIKQVITAALCASGVHEWHYPNAKTIVVKGLVCIREYGDHRICVTCGEREEVSKDMNRMLLAHRLKHMMRNVVEK